MALRQQCMILAPVTLGGGDEANAAVTMLIVVPDDKVTHPDPGGIKARKAALRPLWAVFQRLEQRL